MKCVEFSNVPPKFEIAKTQGGFCIVRLYCNVEHIEREEQDVYIAECHEMKTRYADNLENRIDRNVDAWLAEAKKQEAKEEDAQAKNNYGARLDNVEGLTDDIVLLMAEIIGGEE